MKCTISGSMRKSYDEMLRVIGIFEQSDITVLSPKKSTPIDPGAEFVVLKSDSPTSSIGELEDIHLEHQRNADFVYVVNPKGYIGVSAAYEIAKAEEWGIPIFAFETPADPMLATRKIQVMSPEEVVKFFQR